MTTIKLNAPDPNPKPDRQPCEKCIHWRPIGPNYKIGDCRYDPGQIAIGCNQWKSKD